MGEGEEGGGGGKKSLGVNCGGAVRGGCEVVTVNLSFVVSIFVKAIGYN